MTKKMILWLLTTFLLATAGPVEAQQSGKPPHIVLTRPEQTGSPVGEAFVEAFRQGLRERGYVDGQNVVLEIIWSGGTSSVRALPARLADANRPKVDVIVTSGTASTKSAQKATSSIPIVMANIGADAVTEGFAASLARPGGNITGLTNMSIDIVGKRMELLKDAAPTTTRVAVLIDPSRSRAADLKEIQDAGRALKVQIQAPIIKGPDDFRDAFQAVSKGRAEAVQFVSGGVFNAHRAALVELATKSRLPAMYSEQEYVQAGGLMAYSSSLTDQYRRAAVFVDKILKGSKPADLPIERPIKFDFVVNLKAAKQIGLSVPPQVLAKADRVIR